MNGSVEHVTPLIQPIDSQPFVVDEQRGNDWKLDDTLKRFDPICNSEADGLLAQVFMYTGGVDDVNARAKKTAN